MSIKIKFDDIIDQIITEQTEPEFTSAVAIARYRDRWLLGLSKNSDERKGKWCHPGGHIRSGEKPTHAATRECFEETGIRCDAIGEPFRMVSYKGVAFVPCRIVKSGQKIDVNNEFSAAGLFSMEEIRNLRPLYKNVKQLIERAKK
jgi:8-oxo-dGTP pyrophosphatase MutT (NUDIX family)